MVEATEVPPTERHHSSGPSSSIHSLRLGSVNASSARGWITWVMVLATPSAPDKLSSMANGKAGVGSEAGPQPAPDLRDKPFSAPRSARHKW